MLRNISRTEPSLEEQSVHIELRTTYTKSPCRMLSQTDQAHESPLNYL